MLWPSPAVAECTSIGCGAARLLASAEMPGAALHKLRGGMWHAKTTTSFQVLQHTAVVIAQR